MNATRRQGRRMRLVGASLALASIALAGTAVACQPITGQPDQPRPPAQDVAAERDPMAGEIKPIAAEGQMISLVSMPGDGVAPTDGSDLAVDGAERFAWIGTDRGLVRLETATGATTRLTQGDGLPSNAITAVFVEDDGTVWAGTDAGVARREPDGTFTALTADDGLAEPMVTDIASDGRGGLWVSGPASVSYRDRAGRWRPVHRLDVIEPESPIEGIRELAIDAAGAARFVVDGAAYRITPAGNASTTPLLIDGLAPEQAGAARVAISDDGALWFSYIDPQKRHEGEGVPGQEFRGIFHMDADGVPRRTGDARTHGNLPLLELVVDRLGGVWSFSDYWPLRHGPEGWQPGGTEEELPIVDAITGSQHTPYLFDSGVLSAQPVRDGALWLLTRGGLMRRAADGSGRNWIFSHEQRLQAGGPLAAAPDGGLWFGWPVVLRTASGEFATEPWVDPLDGPSRPVLHASDEGVWIGHRGLTWLGNDGRRERTDTQSAPHYNALPSDNVLSILEASDGSLWVGTDQGLGRRVDDFWSLELFDEAVTGLMEDREGGMWAILGAPLSDNQSTASGRALAHRARDGAWTFPDVPGAEHAYTDGIAEDVTGGIWVTTKDGLAHRVPNGRWTVLGEADGLMPVWQTGTISAADVVFDPASGGVWASSQGGLTRFAPDGSAQESIAFPEPLNIWGAGFVAEASGRVHVATRKEYLILEPDRSWTRQRLPFTSGEPDGATDMGIAPDGTRWFTLVGGRVLERRPDGTWRAYSTAAVPPSSAEFIAVAPDGAMWAASPCGPLYSKSAAGEWSVLDTADGLPPSGIASLAVDDAGSVWVGASGECLAENAEDSPADALDAQHRRPRVIASVRSRDGTWTPLTDKNLELGGTLLSVDHIATHGERTIFGRHRTTAWTAILVDGERWLGRRIPDDVWTLFPPFKGITGDLVGLEVNAEGAAWVAFADGLVRVALDNEVNVFRLPEGAAPREIRALDVGPDGSAWLALEEASGGDAQSPVMGEVLRLDPDGAWTAFGTQNGLPTTHIDDIAVDADGNVWIVTEGAGLAQLVPDP